MQNGLISHTIRYTRVCTYIHVHMAKECMYYSWHSVCINMCYNTAILILIDNAIQSQRIIYEVDL